jgi:hypothetical protein
MQIMLKSLYFTKVELTIFQVITSFKIDKLDTSIFMKYFVKIIIIQDLLLYKRVGV